MIPMAGEVLSLRRAWALLVIVACLLGANTTIAITRTDGRGQAASAPVDAPALQGQVPAPGAAPAPAPRATPTTAAPARPRPARTAPARPAPAAHVRAPVDAPANPRAPEPLHQLGTIEIPRIGLVHPVFEGITLTTIDHGPGHWPGTALPGQPGNAVFAGHRVTHTHPFLQIDQLVLGDFVYFTMNGVRTAYAVTGHDVVRPSDTWIVNQTPDPTATLFACHPPHSARYRYVVHLKLVPG